MLLLVRAAAETPCENDRGWLLEAAWRETDCTLTFFGLKQLFMYSNVAFTDL